MPVIKQQRGANGFVEDWYTEGTSCLNAAARSVTYSNVSYFDAAKRPGRGEFCDRRCRLYAESQ